VPRYVLVTTDGSHFPDLIEEKVSRPGCYQWFRAFSKGGWSGEVRHVKTIAEADYQKWDIIHVKAHF